MMCEPEWRKLLDACTNDAGAAGLLASMLLDILNGAAVDDVFDSRAKAWLEAA